MARYAFCRRCLNLWNYSGDKDSAYCVCTSRTKIIEPTGDDIFKKVKGLRCIDCNYIWFSLAKYHKIKCWKCKKNQKGEQAFLNFARTVMHKAIDTSIILIENFPLISERSIIIVTSRLNPLNVNIDIEEIKKLYRWKKT